MLPYYSQSLAVGSSISEKQQQQQQQQQQHDIEGDLQAPLAAAAAAHDKKGLWQSKLAAVAAAVMQMALRLVAAGPRRQWQQQQQRQRQRQQQHQQEVVPVGGYCASLRRGIFGFRVISPQNQLAWVWSLLMLALDMT
jgi:hypothetical protein